MKHLKKFESHNNYLDDILDKINKSGLSSLSNYEKEYLDAFSKDDNVKMDYIKGINDQKSFKSSDGHFEFVYEYTEDYGDEKYHFGTMYVPNIDNVDEKVEGILEGYIWETTDNQIIPNFEKNNIDIVEFCQGLEYELDIFLEYVIDTLNDEKMNFNI